ncbi:glycoside hydrolase family 43 protein [Prevotella pectinovora]|uniref:glycoside hydrolase family 43 protein n=1 Tax=Prevotella pectinovora TaxID=1602169 RepID=UPI0005B743DF|nr:glycoside hydrolase 43 family protein [Prevotella pectinovora]KIP56601.1 glycoside hydrolase [Prevotella pectinovora]KIP63344.1 glycoside hydrolase [Prevotella pectinovora]
MKRKHLLLMMLALPMAALAQYKSQVWSPDNGNGTYTNPVINADYSDPDVCVAGEDYYLTASSFNCIPGLPILHSKDLVNWEIVGHAVKELEPKQEFDRPSHGNGIWAPSIRYHNGEFYIYWGDPDHGVFMVKAKDPAGEWSKPLCVIPGKGLIDTTPLWDDDGRCYLVNAYANSRSRFASVIAIRELSADGTKPIGNPVIIYDGNGTESRTCEGPKIYKRDGWYWVMFPAGGVPTGFQVAMRSKNPFGPYESKVVLAQGKTKINGPHQGAWVHTKFGEDWFLHFQDKEAYGRVVHLQPVTWKDNWPVMGIDKDGDYCGEPVTTYRKPKTSGKVQVVNPAESDEFSDTRLGLQWQWHANYNETFGMPTAFGSYRVYTHKVSEKFQNLWEVPNLLLQKTPADKFTATTKIRFTSKDQNQTGGLLMMGLDYSGLVVKRVGNDFQLLQISCKSADKGKPQTEQLIATLKPTAVDQIDYQPGTHIDIYMRMSVNDGKMHFSYSLDGKKYTKCGTEFTMREGKWIGAKIGFVAYEPGQKTNRGWIDADWFRVTRK